MPDRGKIIFWKILDYLWAYGRHRSESSQMWVKDKSCNDMVQLVHREKRQCPKHPFCTLLCLCHFPRLLLNSQHKQSSLMLLAIRLLSKWCCSLWEGIVCLTLPQWHMGGWVTWFGQSTIVSSFPPRVDPGNPTASAGIPTAVLEPLLSMFKWAKKQINISKGERWERRGGRKGGQEGRREAEEGRNEISLWLVSGCEHTHVQHCM